MAIDKHGVAPHDWEGGRVGGKAGGRSGKRGAEGRQEHPVAARGGSCRQCEADSWQAGAGAHERK